MLYCRLKKEVIKQAKDSIFLNPKMCFASIEENSALTCITGKQMDNANYRATSQIKIDQCATEILKLILTITF